MATEERMLGREGEHAEFTGVLENLRDLNGARCGFEICDRLTKDGARLILIGEPSGGKTTLITQLAYALNQRHSPVEAFVFYDRILKSVQGEVRQNDPSKVSREMWSGADWVLLDDMLLRAIDRTEGKRALVEIPGVSDKYGIRTRGRDAIKELAHRSPDIFVVYNVADPSTQMWGAFVRETILSTPDEEVFSVMEDQFQAEIVGVPNDPRYGAFYKEAVRWSAKREHIDAIDVEMMQSARDWLRKIENYKKLDEVNISVESTYPYERILGDNAVDNLEQVQKIVESAESKIKRKAAYAKDYLKNVLGVSEDRGFVVFNPFRANTKISVDARLFLNS